MERLAQMRYAGQGFVDAIIHERFHAKQPCLTANILSWLTVECHLSNRRIHDHLLMHRNASAESGVVTVVAPAATHERSVFDHLGSQVKVLYFALTRLVRFVAFGADSAYQTLREHGHDAGCNEEWLYVHIDQPRNSSGRIVRVQGTENQVSCKTCLNSHLGSLKVSPILALISH